MSRVGVRFRGCLVRELLARSALTGSVLVCASGAETGVVVCLQTIGESISTSDNRRRHVPEKLFHSNWNCLKCYCPNDPV
ncbi:hypothetical protein TNCT_525291 [Trichonephila clavata]|uniref:Uncharacterized protein n=1 Tax=Trichonephila clavata TaxID=2740835 RepID=A0A8X6K0F5_TRICU|nr:hypothetical protein TNCT_525291 [Trichonephila clavata]